MATNPLYLRFLQCEEQEVYEAWSELRGLIEKVPNIKSGQSRTLLVNKVDDPNWKNLPFHLLLYDKVLIYDDWQEVFTPEHNKDEKTLDIFEELADRGMLGLVWDNTPADFLLVRSNNFKKLGHFEIINIMLRRFATPRNKRASCSDIIGNLAMLQAQRIVRAQPCIHEKVINYADLESGKVYPYHTEVIYWATRYQICAMLFDTQLSIFHPYVTPLLQKTGWNKATATDMVNEVVFEGQFSYGGSTRDLQRILEIRESDEFIRLRHDLSVIHALPTQAIRQSLGEIKSKITRDVDRVNTKKSLVEAETTGAITAVLATAGSLVGGVPGAIAGGVGGYAVGRGIGYLAGEVLRLRNRNWALFVPAFIGKS